MEGEREGEKEKGREERRDLFHNVFHHWAIPDRGSSKVAITASALQGVRRGGVTKPTEGKKEGGERPLRPFIEIYRLSMPVGCTRQTKARDRENSKSLPPSNTILKGKKQDS